MITIYAIIFPRLFLGIILYVDVVTYQRISDFYRYIWLLLITRGFLAIKGLIQKYAQRNLSKLQDEYFTTTSASNGTAQLSSKFEMSPQIFNDITTAWTSFYNMRDVILAVTAVQSRWYFLLLCLCSNVIYVVAWSTYVWEVVFAKTIILATPLTNIIIRYILSLYYPTLIN